LVPVLSVKVLAVVMFAPTMPAATPLAWKEQNAWEGKPPPTAPVLRLTRTGSDPVLSSRPKFLRINPHHRPVPLLSFQRRLPFQYLRPVPVAPDMPAPPDDSQSPYRHHCSLLTFLPARPQGRLAFTHSQARFPGRLARPPLSFIYYLLSLLPSPLAQKWCQAPF
jgi:hypothetical protein